MQTLWEERNGVYDVMIGSDITKTIADAISLSAEESRPITFEFNGVFVTVKSDSDRQLIYRDWNRALSRYIPDKVGPYPTPVLSDKEKANDEHIEAEHERQRQEEQAKCDAKHKAKREAVEGSCLNGLPSRKAGDATIVHRISGSFGVVAEHLHRPRNKTRRPYTPIVIAAVTRG